MLLMFEIEQFQDYEYFSHDFVERQYRFTKRENTCNYTVLYNFYRLTFFK